MITPYLFVFNWNTKLPQCLLQFANFDIFNREYATDRGSCSDCQQIGIVYGSELQGDYPMTGWVETSEPCESCIGQGKCPNCGADLELSFDASGLPDFEFTTPHWQTGEPITHTIDNYRDALEQVPFDGFTCLVCAWQFDPRARPDDDYYDDWIPDDDPGFDPMFLM